MCCFSVNWFYWFHFDRVLTSPIHISIFCKDEEEHFEDQSDQETDQESDDEHDEGEEQLSTTMRELINSGNKNVSSLVSSFPFLSLPPFSSKFLLIPPPSSTYILSSLPRPLSPSSSIHASLLASTLPSIIPSFPVHFVPSCVYIATRISTRYLILPIPVSFQDLLIKWIGSKRGWRVQQKIERKMVMTKLP